MPRPARPPHACLRERAGGPAPAPARRGGFACACALLEANDAGCIAWLHPREPCPRAGTPEKPTLTKKGIQGFASSSVCVYMLTCCVSVTVMDLVLGVVGNMPVTRACG